MLSIIRKYLMKKAAKAADDGIMITLPSSDKIQFQEQMVIDLLMRNGVDPNAIRSEQMLDNVLNQIEAVEKQNLAQNIRGGIDQTRVSKVMDMEGQEITPGSRIMGGKEVKETEAEIAERIKNQNKQSLEKMKEKSKKKQDRMDDIFGDFDGLDDFAKGGRVGLKVGVGKKGLKAMAEKLGMKFASDLEQPPKSKLRSMFKDFESRNPDLNRQLTDQEYDDFVEELGGEDMIEGYNFDGTVGNAQKILKQQKDYEAQMFQEYKAGRLDPPAGSKKRGRLEFLRKKMEEMEMSGDQKIMTRDDIEELIDLENRYDYLDLVEKAENPAKKMTDAEIQKLKQYNDMNYQGVLNAMDDSNVLRYVEEADSKKIKKASGGIARLGFKAGGIDKMRRAFLKALGAGAATVGAAKTGLLKFGGKQVAKEVVTTPPVLGKPPWFDKLVNKVITEGDDVTKRFAVQDRQTVHKAKINETDEVTVYQNMDDGQIDVIYDSPTNMGEDSVNMTFKPGRADETTKGQKPPDEFRATETEPQYTGGPEDADIEFVGEGGGSDIRMLESDITPLKEFAGEKITTKDIAERIRKNKSVQKINNDTMEQAEYIAGKYGDGPEPPDDYPFASGGIARMLGE